MPIVKDKTISVLVLLTAIIAIFVGGKLQYVLLYLFLFSFILPPLWSRRKLAAVQGKIEVEADRVEVGDRIKVRFSLTNTKRSSIPFLEVSSDLGVDVAAEDQQTKILSLEGEESFGFTREIYCSRRGIYGVDALSIRSADMFGNYTSSLKLSGDTKIKVYPKPHKLDNFNVNAKQFFGSLPATDRIFEDYTRMSSVRRWAQGDTVKKIHWKASAKAGQLIVKEFELKADTKLHVLVDMCQSSYLNDQNYRLEDEVVDSAISIIFGAMERDISVSVTTTEKQGGSFLHANSQEDLNYVLDHFVDLHPTGQAPIANLVVNQGTLMAPKSTLVLITPHLSLPLATSILSVSGRVNPHIFLVALFDSSTEQKQVISSLKNEGIEVVVQNRAGSLPENIREVRGHHGS